MQYLNDSQWVISWMLNLAEVGCGVKKIVTGLYLEILFFVLQTIERTTGHHPGW